MPPLRSRLRPEEKAEGDDKISPGWMAIQYERMESAFVGIPRQVADLVYI